nr:hypothetical protein [Tanacetum cinerariifolium]
MMKGSDIGIQEKKAKLFNEWERLTSNEGESIESFYHRFLKLMNDLKRNKHFPEKIASNLKFLNNLQPEWSQDRQMKMVRGNGGNQFRQYAGQNVGNITGNGNQNQIRNANLVVARAEGNAAGQNGNQIRCYNCKVVEEYDLMAASADIDEIEEVNANCILMANLQQASTSGTQTDNAPVYDSDGSVENIGNQIGLIGVQRNGNQNQIRNANLVVARAEGNAAGQNGNQIRCYNCKVVGHYARNCTIRPKRRDAAYLQTQLLIAQKEEAGI